VKYSTPSGRVIRVRTRSSSLTNGRVRRIKRYTAATIDWIAAFEPISERCLYIPASELGTGRNEISLRLSPTRNCQVKGVRYADDYANPEPPAQRSFTAVEPAGLEPAAFRMQTERSPN
jgi:PD-(D/E)XK endonuclease